MLLLILDFLIRVVGMESKPDASNLHISHSLSIPLYVCVNVANLALAQTPPPKQTSLPRLRFGIAEKVQLPTPRQSSKKTSMNRDAFSEDEVKLILRIRTVSAHRRYLVTEIVEQFALEQEMWHE
jgi:hypothetical protein